MTVLISVYACQPCSQSAWTSFDPYLHCTWSLASTSTVSAAFTPTVHREPGITNDSDLVPFHTILTTCVWYKPRSGPSKPRGCLHEILSWSGRVASPIKRVLGSAELTVDIDAGLDWHVHLVQINLLYNPEEATWSTELSFATLSLQWPGYCNPVVSNGHCNGCYPTR